MKPLRTRLQEARKRLGIPWDVLERDYLLSWVLAGIGQVASLRDTLVFKGGTALKKCYFGDYRFSEDLDFSTVGSPPAGKEMEHSMSTESHQKLEPGFTTWRKLSPRNYERSCNTLKSKKSVAGAAREPETIMTSGGCWAFTKPK